MWDGLQRIDGTLLNGHPTQRVPGILNVSFPGVEGESLVAGLTELALSTGSACNSDSDEASYVLRALGRDAQTAQSSLRFSLGRFSVEEDVGRPWPRCAARWRGCAPRRPEGRVALNEPWKAPDSDQLGPQIRALFAALDHAGELPDVTAGPGRVVRGEAGREAWVRACASRCGRGGHA